jgi:hypothetical protein
LNNYLGIELDCSFSRRRFHSNYKYQLCVFDFTIWARREKIAI